MSSADLESRVSHIKAQHSCSLKQGGNEWSPNHCFHTAAHAPQLCSSGDYRRVVTLPPSAFQSDLAVPQALLEKGPFKSQTCDLPDFACDTMLNTLSRSEWQKGTPEAQVLSAFATLFAASCFGFDAQYRNINEVWVSSLLSAGAAYRHGTKHWTIKCVSPWGAIGVAMPLVPSNLCLRALEHRSASQSAGTLLVPHHAYIHTFMHTYIRLVCLEYLSSFIN